MNMHVVNKNCIVKHSTPELMQQHFFSLLSLCRNPIQYCTGTLKMTSGALVIDVQMNMIILMPKKILQLEFKPDNFVCNCVVNP